PRRRRSGWRSSSRSSATPRRSTSRTSTCYGGSVTFEPILPWAIVLLPLLGFAVNGVTAFLAPERKEIPTLVGPGVLALAFVFAVLNFVRMLGADLHDAVLLPYWSWMPVGSLQLDVALQLDQLSM